MNSDQDLKKRLLQIDHKGYPAYKQLKGMYQFPLFVLGIDHVQGDPFASPSKVSVHVPGKTAGFKKDLYDTKEKKTALEDYILRRFAEQLRRVSFLAKGSGKSGLMSVSKPGQEVMERTACEIDRVKGDIIIRMEIGFPANGRTVNSRELEKILFQFLPECAQKSLYAKALDEKRVQKVMELASDQAYIRKQLEKRDLVAFVANGSILPRESGVSDVPMRDAVKFQSPKEMECEFELPYYGTIKGMAVRRGITLIVGGGYHGKSTLLKALERGVYNHIAGDGREFVITDSSAFKLRAEDGRRVEKTDISMFINHLPNGKDTVHFSTEDASGSTSQAANVVEAWESKSRVFLMDEDTSATNFMIRDELMQRVVHREMEPITPFIERVRSLYEDFGISTVLVAGSSGSYFQIADQIIQMNQYIPYEITDFAKTEAESFEKIMGDATPMKKPDFLRVPKADHAFASDRRIKVKSLGMEGISINKETIDLRYLEQLTDMDQVNALAQLMKYMRTDRFDGKESLSDIVESVMTLLENKGWSAICGNLVPGNLARPRSQEVFACVNRWRSQHFL